MTKHCTSPPDWIVLKFGGSSVSSLGDWQTIAAIITEARRQGDRVLVVQSALRNVTNELETLARAAARDQFTEGLSVLRKRHHDMAGELGLDGPALLSDLLAGLEAICRRIAGKAELTAADRAEVVSFGELLASILGAAWLQKTLTGEQVAWLDAREILRCVSPDDDNPNDRYLNATCDCNPWPSLASRLAVAADVHLTQGFIASNDAGETVLLGREGSDTSAACFAVLLAARQVEIWTDVPGIFSSDPHVVSEARLLSSLTFDEALEMAQAGAKVLHPRCLETVMQVSLPLSVRCTQRPELSGTRVDGRTPETATVKSVNLRRGLTRVRLAMGRRGQQPELLARAFAQFRALDLPIQVVASSKDWLTLFVETENAVFDSNIREQLRERLAPISAMTDIDTAATLTLVGMPAPELYQAVQNSGCINHADILCLNHVGTERHLTLVIPDASAENLTRSLHAALIGAGKCDAVFGPDWQSIMNADM